MSVLMSKEEIALTINRMKDDNDNNLRDGYDRVIERMCNYVEANLDDFMECYDQETDDNGVVHQRDRSEYNK